MFCPTTLRLNLICIKRLVIELDRQLMTQVMTNLIKNAREAVEARLHMRPDPKGRIVVHVYRDEDHVIIDIADNGIGLPRENRNRLLEPYVTTRNKGTGLGLAIVVRSWRAWWRDCLARCAEDLGGADTPDLAGPDQQDPGLRTMNSLKQLRSTDNGNRRTGAVVRV